MIALTLAGKSISYLYSVVNVKLQRSYRSCYSGITKELQEINLSDCKFRSNE